MRTIYIVTGNPLKLQRAQAALDPLNIVIERIDIETPEMQSKDVTEVVKYSVTYASQKTKKVVMKNDQSLEIPSLGGFPGPFAKYLNDWLSAEQLIHMYEHESDKTAYWLDTLGYAEPGIEPVVFVSKISGKLVTNPRGKGRYMLDTLFEVDSLEKTIAELSEEEYFTLWSTDIYTQLADYLKLKNL